MVTYHFFQGIVTRRNLVDALSKGIHDHNTQLSQLVRRFVLSMVAELHTNFSQTAIKQHWTLVSLLT